MKKILFCTIALVHLFACSSKDVEMETSRQAAADSLFAATADSTLPDPLPRIVAEQLAFMRTSLDSATMEETQIMVRRFFSRDSINLYAKAQFQKSYEKPYADSVREWFSSTLHDTIHTLMNADLSENDKKRIIEYANQASRDSAMMRRVRMLRSIQSDSVLTLKKNVYERTMRALLKLHQVLAKEGQDIKTRDIGFVAHAEAMAYGRRLRGEQIYEQLYRLRLLDDAKFNSYVDVMRSPAWKWYDLAINASRMKAVSAASAKLKNSINSTGKE